MPIEIKELHIKVTVNAPQSTGSQAPAVSQNQGSGGNAASDKEAIVAECIEQVLQILQNKKER